MGGVIDIMKRHGVVAWLIGINVAVFLVAALFELSYQLGWTASVESRLTLPSYFALWVREPWTILTYMFMHTHPLHLLMNMLWLAWFGYILLDVFSTRRLCTLYIGGGVAGGALYLCVLSAAGVHDFRLLGASASVLAIMTAAAVLMPSYRVHLFFIGDVKLKWIALCMILLAFLGLGGGNSGGEIAHLGGAAYGLVAALIFRTGHVKLVKNKPGIKPKRVSRVVSVMEQHRIDAERLDELLDKIRISGFDSLTHSERKELQELSKKVVK